MGVTMQCSGRDHAMQWAWACNAVGVAICACCLSIWLSPPQAYPYMKENSGLDHLPRSTFVTCSSDNTVRFWCLDPSHGVCMCVCMCVYVCMCVCMCV